MIHPSAVMFRAFLLVLVFVSPLVACGGTHKRARSDEKLVPEENQKRARELGGQQQQMMNDLSLTPAEQAAEAHGARTTPVENPKYSKEDEEK